MNSRAFLIAPLILFSFVAVSRAQSVWGNTHVSARCAGSQDQAPVQGTPTDVTLHGVCPAPRYNGNASDNFAHVEALMDPGWWRARSLAQVNFYGTRDDAGAADGYHDLWFQASDLVFTSIANPGQSGNISFSTNYLFRMSDPPNLGISNCSPYAPQSEVQFHLYGPGGGNADGYFNRQPGVLTVNGAFAGYPNDFTWALGSAPGFTALAFPTTLSVRLGTLQHVGYCDSPPADFGQAAGRIEVALPCGTPVFDLPAGYTVNSTQLGIVNNVRVGCTLETTLKVTKNTATGTVRLDWIGGQPSTVRRARNAQFTLDPQTPVNAQVVTSYDDAVLNDGRTYFYLVN